MPPTGADSNTPSTVMSGKLEIAVEREQQQEDQEQRQRQHDAQLLARGGVFRVFAAPIEPVAFRQRDLRVDLLPGIVHRAGQVAAFHRELHADVARIVLAINERGAVRDLDVGKFLQWNLLTVGRRDQDVADLLRVVAELLFQPHHQVELLFALHHLRRRRRRRRPPAIRPLMSATFRP